MAPAAEPPAAPAGTSAVHPRAAAAPPPAARGVRRVGACPVCELSQQPDFAEHVHAWRRRFAGAPAPDRVEIGVAACSHHCNATLVHEIAVVARRHGYSIAVGGKADGIPSVARWLVEGIPAEQVEPAVAHVLDVYRRLARGRERLSRVVARVGVEPFAPPGLGPE
jgi:NAD(P)H-nitrite reductase large subunit